MNIYLAESGGIWKAYFDKNLFRSTNILQSFYYVDDFTINNILPVVKNFLLDSGAFTFMASGKKVDWAKYVDAYIDFINKYDIQYFFELDIDSIIGYENVIKIREYIEQKTGKKSIPVWHFNRGKEEFIKMCKEYPYVAFGGLNTDGIKRSEIVKYMPWFIETAHKYGAKIHGLGFTSLKDLPKLKFDSVDSTSWVSGNRFGSVYKFNGTTMIKFDKQKGQRLADTKKVAINNFVEWNKFCKYAERNL